MELLNLRGVDVIEVRTCAPAVGPNRLHRGPAAYRHAGRAALETPAGLGL